MFSILFGMHSNETAKYAICPNCEKKIAVELWDEQTRAFLGKNIPRVVSGTKSKIPYQCPKCYIGYLSKYLKFVD